MADKNMSRGLNTEKEIDNALRGLKAIRREARLTIQTLKDLQNVKKDGAKNE
jgi:hypothetical protein